MIIEHTYHLSRLRSAFDLSGGLDEDSKQGGKEKKEFGERKPINIGYLFDKHGQGCSVHNETIIRLTILS